MSVPTQHDSVSGIWLIPEILERRDIHAPAKLIYCALEASDPPMPYPVTADALAERIGLGGKMPILRRGLTELRKAGLLKEGRVMDEARVGVRRGKGAK